LSPVVIKSSIKSDSALLSRLLLEFIRTIELPLTSNPSKIKQSTYSDKALAIAEPNLCFSFIERTLGFFLTLGAFLSVISFKNFSTF